MCIKLIKTFLFLVLMSQTSLEAQKLKLPLLFSDHMVYQRDKPFLIWGWDEPGQPVTVKLNNYRQTSITDDTGSWAIELPAQSMGGPYSITIKGSTTEILSDIYIGDVWIAGGQSNMEWKLNMGIIGAEEEIHNSNYPGIRFFEIPKTNSFQEISTLDSGEWHVSNPMNSPNFSAVAWYYAKKYHLETGIPIGIISSNWGGTPAESWLPVDELLDVPGYEEDASEILNPEIDWNTIAEDNSNNISEMYRRVTDTTDILTYGIHLENFDSSDWDTVNLPNPIPLTDFVWLRKTIELKSDDNVQLSFGNPGKFTVLYINGKQVYSKIWSDDPSIIEIDKSILRIGKNTIVLRTVEDWSNETYIGKKNEFWITTSAERISLEGSWDYSNTMEPPLPEIIRLEHLPGTLYNGMIHPLIKYPIKGTIWYQGESNVNTNQYYRALFSKVIESWRERWGYNFPFLFVQLANFQKRYDYPTDSDWAKLREAQTQTYETINNTGIAVTIDIGEANDIHPRNKKDVGERLWLAARKVVFEEDLIYSGPMYKSHEVHDDYVEVSFHFAESGWYNEGINVDGFAIAGKDSVFHWATVKLEDNTVILSSDQVQSPVAIRYAWADNPKVSLYNKEGLPVVPFRTDNW